MDATSWYISSLNTSHIARPYTWSSSGYTPHPHEGQPIYPAGSLHTSSIKLARNLNAFTQKRKLGDVRILDSTTVALMTTIHYPRIPIPGYPDSSQGLIWYQEYFGDHLVWEHDGGWDAGATTTMYYYEPEKSGVIVLINQFGWKGVSTITSFLFDYFASIVTHIAQSDENMLGGFLLKQNYPNPFNPVTTIEFSVPESGFVSLKIYNILGQKVASLVSEIVAAGNYQLWNASRFASDLYPYRLEAEDPSTNSGQVFVQTKKLILMR